MCRIRAMGDHSLAAGIATRAHRGQVDKQGVPYIRHPATVAALVAAAGGSDDQIDAAWLHDVIEDTDITADDLLAAGVRAEVVEIVVALSRTPDRTYMEFIQAIPQVPAAVLVKLVDLEHNMDPARPIRDPDGNALPTNPRYIKAHAFLTATMATAEQAGR